MKLVLYMAMSLDGYIATVGDETPWPAEVWDSYYKLGREFGAIVVGRKTYNLMKDAKEFAKLGDPVTVTLSHVCDVEPVSLKHYCAESPREVYERLVSKGIQKALLGGGQQTNTAFMTEQLVDELMIDVCPTLLGDGLRLFEAMPYQTSLELIGTKKIGKNTLRLHYRVVQS